MNEKAKSLLISLSLKNPKVALIIIAIVIVLFFASSAAMIFFDAGNEDSDIPEGGSGAYCTEGTLNQSMYSKMFEDAGAFTGHSDTFISTSNQFKIDPVLLAAIAFNETGSGKSKMVRERNNPGGLYNSSKGEFFTYPSLEDGIAAMAKNLYKNYISMGLVTIQKIGAKYAPIGAENDPNNLNANWVPNVTSFINKFGGLSMNCSDVLIGTGEFAHPIPGGRITSPFGYRIHPITGEHKLHKGIDYGCSVGDSIFSALSGKVKVAIKSGYGSGYGHHVIIDHGDKFTLYGHMTNVNVDIGQTVEKGQTIGTCGSTGASTGAHLHFEVQLGLYTNHVDPKNYLGGE